MEKNRRRLGGGTRETRKSDFLANCVTNHKLNALSTTWVVLIPWSYDAEVSRTRRLCSHSAIVSFVNSSSHAKYVVNVFCLQGATPFLSSPERFELLTGRVLYNFGDERLECGSRESDALGVTVEEFAVLDRIGALSILMRSPSFPCAPLSFHQLPSFGPLGCSPF